MPCEAEADGGAADGDAWGNDNLTDAGQPANEMTRKGEVKHMPRGDGTGPDGKGQRPGRGQGPCGQNNQPDQTQGQEGKRGGRGAGQGKGRGGGRGQGGGSGRGRGGGQNR